MPFSIFVANWLRQQCAVLIFILCVLQQQQHLQQFLLSTSSCLAVHCLFEGIFLFIFSILCFSGHLFWVFGCYFFLFMYACIFWNFVECILLLCHHQAQDSTKKKTTKMINKMKTRTQNSDYLLIIWIHFWNK